MASMEKKEKKSRSRSSADVEAADADEMMRRMLDEAEVAGQEKGSRGSEKGGGLLENLLPVGPPLSLAPKESVDTVGTPKASVTRGTQKTETPEVKRVAVRGDDKPREDPRETGTHRTPREPVHGVVSEHDTREATGKGRGSGTATKGVGSRDVVSLERHVGGHLEKTEHFYIGDSSAGAGRSVEIPTRMGDIVNPF